MIARAAAVLVVVVVVMMTATTLDGDIGNVSYGWWTYGGEHEGRCRQPGKGMDSGGRGGGGEDRRVDELVTGGCYLVSVRCWEQWRPSR